MSILLPTGANALRAALDPSDTAFLPTNGAASKTRSGPGGNLAPGDVSRIIEMGWEDRTPFEDIEREYGLNESAVIALMRREMKVSSFRMWRKRMAGRATKHEGLQQERMQAKRPCAVSI